MDGHEVQIQIVDWFNLLDTPPVKVSLSMITPEIDLYLTPTFNKYPLFIVYISYSINNIVPLNISINICTICQLKDWSNF